MTSLYRSVVFLLSVATIQVQGGKNDQNQPESQLPTLHADSPFARPKLLRPTCMRKSDSKPYLRQEENDDRLLFTECEDMYLQLKYNYVKKPSMGMHSSYLQLATKKSDGSKVLLKTIEKEYVIFYSFESTSPSELHGAEVSAIYGKYAGEKCMSPRPQNSVLPFEIEMQKYLSQDGYGSPHVPRVIDYVVTESTYVLVMEYPGEEWMALDEYTTEHGKLSVDEVRLIIKEVMTALSYLKSLGVAHGSVAGENVLYNKKTGGVKLMNFGFSGLLEGWNQGNSASGSSKDESDSWGTEKGDTRDIGQFMYHLLTSKDPYNDQAVQKDVAKKLGESLGTPESQSAIDAVDLVTILFNKKSSKMTSLEDILGHPFFTRQ
ncbi:hypothetical protein BASA50_004469 [Batrachochytrium salamandrivorans]|uniref:non-specific serine/threonine protein kinase n=1 Tax=Batrachochytrium salamandrivorans TaxID=1357716 RepID=A0ABQ8FG16_9FUNG|nr:hypothetical protein BASA50_004469 [Batrachochytrium salamandrivorans]